MAKTVGQADLVIANGIGYDGWMKVALTQRAKLIRVGEDVMHRKEGLTSISGMTVQRARHHRTIR